MCGAQDGPSKKRTGDDGRPSPEAAMRNMRVDMPAGRKFRLVVRNNALKLVRLNNCCGHYGEPGC